MKNKTLTRIQKMLKPEKKAIIIISLLAILINIGEAIKPYLIEQVIDNYLSQGIWAKGAITIGIIGAIYIAIVILRRHHRIHNKHNHNNGRRKRNIQPKKQTLQTHRICKCTAFTTKHHQAPYS